MSAFCALTVVVSFILGISSNADGAATGELLYSVGENISLFTLEDNEVRTIITGLDYAQSMDIDVEQKYIFWIEYGQDVIRRASIGSDRRVTHVKDIVRYDTHYIDTIAVDWIYNHIYWNYNKASQIRVTDFDGIVRKTFDVFDGGFTTDIILDPRAGWMFYIREKISPALERMGMDGDVSTRSIIVDSDIARTWPTALSVDYSTKRLYWIDIEEKVILSVNYDGLNKARVALNDDQVTWSISLAILQDTIYWTDRQYTSNSICSVNKETGGNFTVIVQDLQRIPFSLHAVEQHGQPNGENFCIQQNSSCSHMCLPRVHRDGNTEKYSCACPDGYQLGNDETSCHRYFI